MSDFKRVLVIADLHCGHRAGLTPPKYQSQIPGQKIFRLQYELWNKYVEIVNSLKPIYLTVVNGDAIDGKGKRSGGTEQIPTDRHVQAKMATEAIGQTEAEHYRFTHGTPYHTGVQEDWETPIAEHFNAKIGDQEWIDVDGVVFDIKHKVGGSSIPHGRHTALARERLWNIIWYNEREQQPDADILIRSHVHYHTFNGDPNYLAMTTPALQAAATKWGGRQCSGTVHWGVVWFDVYPDGRYTWNREITVLESQKARAEKL